MAVRKINESTLTAIGNAIRSKTGGSALIYPEDMATEIDSIQTGGGGIQWKTVSMVGNDTTTLRFPIEYDTAKGGIFIVSTTEPVPNSYSPEIIKEAYHVRYGVNNRVQGFAYDSGNTLRSPNYSVTATQFSIPTTRAFSSLYTYVLKYAEF